MVLRRKINIFICTKSGTQISTSVYSWIILVQLLFAVAFGWFCDVNRAPMAKDVQQKNYTELLVFTPKYGSHKYNCNNNNNNNNNNNKLNMQSLRH